ncbi:MAG: YbfB/YjiJ family MFS transporter [Desulfobulbaceae bacterium]|nr:YbfB/YjiJ family MFS transporter [Desulfobulbaceae bacterium]
MTDEIKSRHHSTIHYGWFVVAAGTLCIFAGLGFGRFALGMLLPAMGKSLSLSYSQMGLISTLNFVGYLVAVLLCGKLSRRFGPRRLITAALLLVGLSMACISITENLFFIILFYTLTGMGSAMSNVPMMGLVPAWFSRKKRGKAGGFMVIGSGFAIILCGRMIPWLNGPHGEGWRTSWLVLGLIVLAAALICFLVLRDNPGEKGLQPVGSEFTPGTGAANPFAEQKEPHARFIYHCAALYFLFGFTYVIYATFIVTAMVQERGFSQEVAGNFWSWVGFLSLFSGPVFGVLSDKAGRRTALMTVFGIQTVAYLLVGLNTPGISLYLSIGCYGIVAWSIPTIMAALVGDHVGAQRVVSVFGFITFVFGLGQISGPYLAGILAEMTGSFSSSFLLASSMTAAAVFLSALLPVYGDSKEKSKGT